MCYFHFELLNKLCKVSNYSVILYVTVALNCYFSPHSEETEKGHLAGTKENVFGKYSDGFPCHLSVINFSIIHVLRQL